MVCRHHDHHAEGGEQDKGNELAGKKFACGKIATAVDNNHRHGNRNGNLQEHGHAIYHQHAAKGQARRGHRNGETVDAHGHQRQRSDG